MAGSDEQRASAAGWRAELAELTGRVRESLFAPTPLMRVAKAATGAIAGLLLTFVLLQVRHHLAPRHALISYLILVIAFAYSIGPAAALGVGAVGLIAIARFFVPPFDTWIVQPTDRVVLVGFAILVLLEARFSGQLRRRTHESEVIASRSNFAAKIAALLLEHHNDFTSDSPVITTLAEGTRASRLVLYAVDTESYSLVPFSEPDAGTDALAEAVIAGGVALGDPTLNPREGELPASWPRVHPLPEGLAGLAIPVATSERLEGVLCLMPPEKGDFDADRVRLAVTAATLIAAALERSRLERLAGEQKAEASAQALKAVFMSSVSHELKSPLAALEAITSDWSDDENLTGLRVEQDLPIVREALGRLTANITDLLNLTRLQGDALHGRTVACEAGDVIARAVELLDPRLRERIDPDVSVEPVVIMCDFDQLARALSSIIRNALAYGGPGRVRVGVTHIEAAVRMWVEDEGPGIDPEERERIFEPFYRGEKTRSAVAGSGVGLAIAREVVRYHRGELHIEPVEPHGARFVMTLPLESVIE